MTRNVTAQIAKALPKSAAKADPVAVTFLQDLRNLAVANEITATEALRRTLQAFPKVSRVGLKHAAILVGINGRTARNTYDRVINA